MKCPACSNPLVTMRAGSVNLDVCQGGCGGIWFDAWELQRVSEQPEGTTEFLFQIQWRAGISVDTAQKRACPRCEGIKLKRRPYSLKCQVEVDECPGCAGFWLDFGELEVIRREMRQGTKARGLSSATFDGQMIRYLSNLHTAQDRKPD